MSSANELRAVATQALRDSGYKYANATNPLDAWIFEEILHIDPRTVVSLSGTVTKGNYCVYVLDEHGNKIPDVFDTPVIRIVYFTPDQRYDVEVWWDLFSDLVRYPRTDEARPETHNDIIKFYNNHFTMPVGYIVTKT